MASAACYWWVLLTFAGYDKSSDKIQNPSKEVFNEPEVQSKLEQLEEVVEENQTESSHVESSHALTRTLMIRNAPIAESLPASLRAARFILRTENFCMHAHLLAWLLALLAL